MLNKSIIKSASRNDPIHKFILINIRKYLFIAFIISLCFFINAQKLSSEERNIHKSILPKPYFLLIYSSYQNQIDKLNIENIKVINDLPYHGIGVRITWEFDDKSLEFDKLKRSAEFIKKSTNKQIWPWVFLNRIVGVNEKEQPKDIIKDKPYFLKIKGIDIYDEAKALSDFYELWRFSLRLAKYFSSPGIIFDIETYNKYEVNKINYLAQLNNKSKDDIIRQLEFVGTKLIEIAEKEYPDAIIWFLFTHLGDPPPYWYPLFQKHMSVSHIVIGMLKEAEKRNLPLKFISGGEIGLGYCHSSISELIKKINKRKERFEPFLVNYPKLHLGGTIAPWNNSSLKKGWMKEGECIKSKLETMEDFIVPIQTLAKNYDYIWIYATPMAGYDAYDKSIAEQFSLPLKRLFLNINRK